ncbi:hemicentin-2-like [Pecten maximus]|uniref:hemicentin-2-like n=1 Tax=Pecten maximus TaxID=6579 RepID=UPI001458EF31|nr:hemicentin-2-like [Pecten maximus]
MASRVADWLLFHFREHMYDKNVVGESTIITSVTVQYGPSTVSLTPPTVTYTPTEGQTIPTITCSADCNPACTYSWTKDGQSYTTGSGLQLTNIQRSQGGVYRCTASNGYGSARGDDVSITVYYGPGTSRALSPPDTTYTRTEGDTLPDITCTADCRPGCTFVWTRPDNTNFTVSPVLSLGQLDRSEHGTYRCTAMNVGGESTITTSVTVQYGPGTSITLSPTDTTYTRTEGDTLPDITCTADCRPGCTFVWTRPDNTNFTVSPVLSLGQLDRSEHGTYRCTARNVGGESTIITSVTVQFPPNILNLNFIKGDGTLTEGSSISLVCSVESFPPSTIQWFYKANNTVLLTTPDVLESTYTLTNADCLDTGLYTCSVRNSVSTTAVTRDISVNVLCKPREDPRVNGNHRFGLATSDDLTLTAMFLANPEPSFMWTFQDLANKTSSELKNGTDSFIKRNSFDRMNLSALSMGIRKDMHEDMYGTYTVTAKNSQGSGRINFSVEPQGKPNPPYEGIAICPSADQAILSWRSAFDGGSTQTFVVGKRIRTQGIFVIDRQLDTPDPGQHRTAIISISGLTAGTQYFFVVFAVNKFGNSTFERDVNCTTQVSQVHASACGTDSMYVPGVVLTITGVITLLFTVGLEIIFRRNRKLCCSKLQLPKQKEFQNIQLSERDGTPHRDNERSLYDQLDTNDVAKASVYSELGGHHHVYQNDPVSEGNGGQYEALKGRTASNVYEELHSQTASEKETYVNTAIGGKRKQRH